MQGFRLATRSLLRDTIRFVLCGSGLLALIGCESRPAVPVLDDLYSPAARSHVQDVHPVVVIPGILGSRLVDEPSGQTVWGAFAGDYARPDRRDGARLVALPLSTGGPLSDATDSVVTTGVLDSVRVNLAGLPVTLAAYVDVLRTLGVGGYRDEMFARAGSVVYADDHFTCFQFAYDWRRDNAQTAGTLYRYLLDKRREVHQRLVERRGEAAPAEQDIKFDLVAHSMGGLVARYMLRYGDAPLPEDGSLPELTWKGAKLVDRVILVGTPNAGSAEAVRQLIEGKDFGNTVAFWLPEAPAVVLGTMPSIYQLMPRARHGAVVDDGVPVDLFDPQEWIRREIGLASPEADRVLGWLLPELSPEERRATAIEHLRKCLAAAEQFHRAIDRPARLPDGVELLLFAGDAVATSRGLDIGTDRIRTRDTAAGDGTVLRSSALMDERLDGDWQPRLRTPVDWTGVNFLFQDHLGITRSPEFSDKVLYLLLEAPRGNAIGSPGGP
jgi:pimeloyl-ACP methyl ester carboxylesterase